MRYMILSLHGIDKDVAFSNIDAFSHINIYIHTHTAWSKPMFTGLAKSFNDFGAFSGSNACVRTFMSELAK
jgi:hypothetical protein